VVEMFSSMVAGKVELSIILCISSGNGISIEAVPNGLHQLIDSYNLNIFIAKVTMDSFLSVSSTVSR
jgi:ABC-type transporter Mla MlaB component